MWYPALVEPRFGASKGYPMARGRSLTEFQEEFPDEASCAAFLFRRRWPDGFVCPSCGGNRAAALKSRAYTFECYGCGRHTSITAGTAAADGVVLGRPFDGNTFQRHVGAAVGGSTRPHLQNSLAAGAETSALDGRSGSRTSPRRRRSRSGRNSFSRRRQD